MGNCIKRNRLIAMAIGNVRKFSHLQGGGRRNDVVDDDHESTTELQNQNNVESLNVNDVQNKTTSNRPSPPGKSPSRSMN